MAIGGLVAGSVGMGLILSFKDFASKHMKTAEKNFGKLDAATQRSIKTQQKAMTAMKLSAGAMLGGLGILYGLKKCSDASAEYRHEMKKFQALSGATDEVVKSMSRNFLEYSAALPVSANEMAEVALGAVRMGIYAEQGQKGTEAFSIAIIELGSVMETVPIEELSRSVGKMSGLFRTAPEDLGRLTSALLYTASSSKVTESELLNTTEGLLGLSQMMGWTEAQTIGMAGAIGDAAVTSQVGASAMTRFFAEMAKDMDKFAGFIGVSAEELTQIFREDAPAALGMFIDKLKSMEEGSDRQIQALDEMGFGGVRVGRALMGLAGIQTTLQDKMAASTRIAEEGTYAHEQFVKVTGSLISKQKTAAGSMTNLAIIVGDILEPAMIRITDAIVNFLSWLINLSPVTQKIIVIFTAALGVFLLVGGMLVFLGAAIVYARMALTALGFRGGLVTKAFSGMWKAIVRSVIAVNRFSEAASEAAARGIGRFIASLKRGITNVIAFSVALLRRAVVAVASFAVSLAVSAVAAISSFAAALIPAIAGAWAFTVALLANPITWIVIGIVALIAGLILLVKNWDKVSAALGTAWKSMKSVFSTMIKGVADVAVAVKDSIGRAFSWVWRRTMELGSQIKGIFVGIKDFVVGIWTTVIDSFKWVLNKFIGYANTMIEGVNNVSKYIGVSIPPIPELDVGGTVTVSPNFQGVVPRGTKVPVLLEEGERVAPVGAAGAESLSSPYRAPTAGGQMIRIEMPVYLDSREIYRSVKEISTEEAARNYSVREFVGRGTT